jgi:hypothetical protein
VRGEDERVGTHPRTRSRRAARTVSSRSAHLYISTPTHDRYAGSENAERGKKANRRTRSAISSRSAHLHLHSPQSIRGQRGRRLLSNASRLVRKEGKTGGSSYPQRRAAPSPPAKAMAMIGMRATRTWTPDDAKRCGVQGYERTERKASKFGFHLGTRRRAAQAARHRRRRRRRRWV